MILGIKYEENRSTLRKRILNGDINSLETQAKNHGCYLCGKHIEGKMFILTLDKEKGSSKFYVGEGCYRRAQLFVDYHGMPVSLN
jgi:hypothetical protein